MVRSKPLPSRRSTRLKGFDFATSAGHVITNCTDARRPLFGSIRDGEMHLSALGSIVDDEWRRTPLIRPAVLLDARIVMTNHVHGIVILNQEDPRQLGRRAQDGRPPAPVHSLGAIVRGLKAAVTARAWPELSGIEEPIWQRNYHDHSIRDDRELEEYRGYIDTNPKRWELDRYNEPARTKDSVPTST
jgi:REP element-mobilizing transposase RayT